MEQGRETKENPHGSSLFSNNWFCLASLLHTCK